MIGWWPGPHWLWPVGYPSMRKGAHWCPRVPSASQHCRRSMHAGAPACESLLVVLVRLARYQRLIGGRDLIVDSAPVLAWRRADPDAAVGHAPHHHARPLLRGYRVHTLLCRASGLPVLFWLAPANYHD